MNFDILHNFISPVTGKLPIQTDYVLIGDYRNFSLPSPIIIDIRLDLIDLRQDVEELSASSFILGFPNNNTPNAQVLSSLANGFMFNTAGIVSTLTIIPITALPDLTYGYVWLGDINNRPVETLLELCPMGATYVLNTPNSLLTNAQALSDLSGGILKSAALTGIISIASGGGTPFIDDYVDPFTLQIQIAETKAFATAEAAAAEAAAISTSISYFTAQMAPYVPSVIPFTGIGFQITGAIGAAAALATAAQSSADNANTRIDNLSVAGDVIGTNMGSDIIVTVFTPNPTFAGKSHMKIPTGNIAERPLLPVQGMIRYNIEI